jgi:hypothetical protein
MPIYIVFVVNQSPAETDIAPTWAMLNRADSPEDAVQEIIATGMLPPSDEVYVSDVTDADIFMVERTIDVTIKPVPSGDPPLVQHLAAELPAESLPVSEDVPVSGNGGAGA